MKFPRSMLRVALLLIGLSQSLVISNAQFDPLLNPRGAPQAKTPEELDAYLEIATAQESRVTIEKVEQFASKYPSSELLGVAYQDETLAYKQVNDIEGVLRAGKRTLELQPNNVTTLLTLAAAIPNAVERRSNAAEFLDQAEEYAQRALQQLTKVIVPHEVTLERWTVMRGEMEALAHEALGHVAAKRGNLPRAMSELEEAAFHNPTPQGSQFYRLGVVYVMLGKYERADQALRRAADLGPDAIRQLALRELKRLNAAKPSRGQVHTQ